MDAPDAGQFDVYVSYKSEDRQVVRRLVDRLTEHGFSVWWDQLLEPGEEWDTTASILPSVRALIICVGAYGLRSKYQLEELNKADALKKPIVPVRVEGFPGFNLISAPRRLQDIQWLDYEHEQDESFAALVRTIRDYAGESDAPRGRADEERKPAEFEWGIVFSERDRRYATELAEELEHLGDRPVVARRDDEGLTHRDAQNIVVILGPEVHPNTRAVIASGVQAVLVTERHPRPRHFRELNLSIEHIPQLSAYRYPLSEIARILLDPIELQREGSPRCPWVHRGDDPVVFGRSSEAHAIAERLKTQPRLLLVSAPARSGKTAFFDSAVWSDAPRIAPGPNYWAGMRLGDDPYQDLKHWKQSMLKRDLTPQTGDPDALPPQTGDPDAAKLAEHTTELPLSAAHRRVDSGRRLMLFIDQVERVFETDEKSREAFLAEIADAVTSESGVQIAACIRSEALGRLRAHEAFEPLLDAALFYLAPMTRDALQQAIVGPAAEFELTVEDSLVKRVLDDIGERSDAIDQLATVMAAVWEERSGSTLTAAAYRKLGGAARILDAAKARQTDRDLAGVRLLPGFRADSVDAEDKLDITPIVEAFCSIMLSRQVEPPLSIGLFGDWGTGKSFFMEEMYRQVESLAERSRDPESPHWHGHVAQIRFNAWHYSDSNLWASFVTHIFDELSRAINPRETHQETRAKLLKELESSKTLAAEANFELEAAKRERDATKKELERQSQELTERSQTLEGIRLGDLETMLSDPIVMTSSEVADVRTRLGELSTTLGIRDAQRTVSDVGRTVDQAKTIVGKARGLWTYLRGRYSRRNLVLACVVLALPTVALGVSYVLDLPLVDTIAGKLRVAIAAGVQALAFVPVLAKYLPPVLKKIEQLEKVRDRLQLEANAKIRGKLQPAQAAVDATKAAVTAAEEKSKRAEQRVADAERAYVEASDGRRFFKFIEERSASDDYRKQLGMISLVHRDFRELQGLLKNCDHYAPDPAIADLTLNMRRVERIILYIDDLDRCQPQLVVAVLQAVHLLLALPLFVVVVGVDPRWLLRALEVHYPEFLSMRYRKGDDTRRNRRRDDPDNDEDEEESSATTPQNYLEKIFQIPFCLPGMGKTGFEGLIDALAKTEELKEATRFGKKDVAPGASERATMQSEEIKADERGPDQTKPDEGEPQVTKPQQPSPSSAEQRDPSTSASAAGVDQQRATLQSQAGDSRASAGGGEHVRTPPRPVEISQTEREFMRELHPLIQTPRATKRFVNVYRLVRSIRLKNDRPFVDSEFRVTLILLALNMSVQRLASQLFRELYRRSPQESWSSVVDALAPRRTGDEWTTGLGVLTDEEAAEWTRVTDCLRDLTRRYSMPASLEPYQKCAAKITRFAFWPPEEVARIPAQSPKSGPARSLN